MLREGKAEGDPLELNVYDSKEVPFPVDVAIPHPAHQRALSHVVYILLSNVFLNLKRHLVAKDAPEHPDFTPRNVGRDLLL